ncbi:MAG: phosphoethanolamine transferase domain-containing protein, partial [Pseudomonadota bacterium]|nr:phosphoethanolamine transferase domain-containing protein [Pseudomonadota bacterium]
MLTFDRLAAPLLLTTYLLLSLVPFFGWAVGAPVAHPAATAGLELLMWATLWAICQRPGWFHWALLPAFVAMPIELYLRVFFGQGISTHHLGIIVETSPAEAMEFLGQKVWWLALLAVLLVFWWGVTAWLALRRPVLVWRGWTRWAALIMVCGAAVAVAATTARTTTVEASRSASAAPVHGVWPIRVERATLADTWPFGIALHGVDFYKERKYLAELAGASRSFLFGARQLT